MPEDTTTSESVTKQSKSTVVGRFKIHEKDCGSPEVQIALLTKRIEGLISHFNVHKEDKHSKIGMFRMISRRKSLLKYLKDKSPERYKATIGALNLRK
jgi:small subunit ribosomal protein S15